MAKITSSFRSISEDCEAAIIPIHHARMVGSNAERDGDRLRGHSSIEAAWPGETGSLT